MTDFTKDINGFSLPKVRILEEISDYAYWRRNASAYITRHDPPLLRLIEEPLSNSAAARTAWEKGNATAKSNITLMLSEQVQIQAIPLCHDPTKTAYYLWKFLESSYNASNEEAQQNLRVEPDSLVYVDGSSWDKNLSQFNSLIAQLAMQNVVIDDKQKKSMLIRWLPESLSVISTVSSAQKYMTIESFDALVRAEIDRKSYPHNT